MSWNSYADLVYGILVRQEELVIVTTVKKTHEHPTPEGAEFCPQCGQALYEKDIDDVEYEDLDIYPYSKTHKILGCSFGSVNDTSSNRMVDFLVISEDSKEAVIKSLEKAGKDAQSASFFLVLQVG